MMLQVKPFRLLLCLLLCLWAVSLFAQQETIDPGTPAMSTFKHKIFAYSLSYPSNWEPEVDEDLVFLLTVRDDQNNDVGVVVITAILNSTHATLDKMGKEMMLAEIEKTDYKLLSSGNMKLGKLPAKGYSYCYSVDGKTVQI